MHDAEKMEQRQNAAGVQCKAQSCHAQEHFLKTEDDSKYKVLPTLSRHLVQELTITK